MNDWLARARLQAQRDLDRLPASLLSTHQRRNRERRKMSYHNVTVETENGDVRTYRVRDVNHWESGVLELVFEDGHSKIIKKYVECDVSEPLDEETDEPIETLHEIDPLRKDRPTDFV